MKNIVSNLQFAIKSLIKEEGQDLVEYALLVALIAFGVTTGVRSAATSINTLFSNISTAITTQGS